jgi:methionine-rich copper-binding protein CopC
MSRWIGAAAVVVMLSGSFPDAALAHSHLKKSIPSAGATVASGPTEVRLQFDENIEAPFSAGRAGCSSKEGAHGMDS